MFQLDTPRLILRDFLEADWQIIYDMAQEPAITRYQSLLRLKSEDESRQWVRNCIFYNNELPREAYNLVIVAKDKNHTIGWIGWGRASDPTKGDYGFGYALRPEYWGKGYMTEALHAALAFMFEVLGAQCISDYCESTNHASARVMEKAGMGLVENWMEEDESGMTAEYVRYAIQKAEWTAQFSKSSWL